MSSWESYVRKVVPYVPGEQPQEQHMIKLNTNENPYPPAPGVIRALKEFDTDRLRLYPEPTCKVLVDAIAEYYRLKSSQVFVGVGSDDVLAMIFMTFFNSKTPVWFPDITYSFYPVWCEMLHIPFETIPVDDSFNINAADYKRPNGGVVIANPNAPTSIGRCLDFMREILDANPDSVVISDEAYVDFGGTSSVPLLKEYENLVVVQTFSKSRSMAGMRIGYALGNKEIISALFAAKDSYNSYPLDSVAIAAGVASVEDEEYFRATVQKVVATRRRLTEELCAMGFDVADSSTNFLFAEHPKYRAKDIQEYLKTRDIYVRYFSKKRIDNRLRITIGTDEEIDALISALRDYIK